MGSKTESDAEDGARPFARTAPAAAFAPGAVAVAAAGGP
jgi:hypothetical protein